VSAPAVRRLNALWLPGTTRYAAQLRSGRAQVTAALGFDDEPAEQDNEHGSHGGTAVAAHDQRPRRRPPGAGSRPYAPVTSRSGSRAGSTIHALPGDSVRPGSLPAVRVTVRRSAMWGRYRPCHLMGFSRSAYERLQAAGGCAFAGSFLLAWRMITVIRALRPRLACAGSGPLARGGQGCVDRVTVSLVVPAPAGCGRLRRTPRPGTDAGQTPGR
jgi:hypothetical protein